MAKTKSFEMETPTNAFITGKTDDRRPDPTIQLKNIEVPRGYKLVKESKSKRIQLLVTPSTFADLKAAALTQDISLNQLCNRIFEEYLRGDGETC